MATGFPSANLSKPVLETYYLSPNNYYQKRHKRPKRRKGNSIAGMVRDRSGFPLIGASILEQGTTNGTITDIDGAFSLRLSNLNSMIEISYTGYESKVLETTTEYLNVILEEGTILDEVVVSSYSFNNLAGVKIRGESRKTEYQVPLAIKKNVTQRIFDIDIPYSISSDGRNNKVTLLTYNIDSDYRYEIVPKVEEKAYLVASINDWYQYELLSGNMNIYFDGIYQGDYFLDLDKEQENLQLSIGVDNNIKVSRKPSKDFKDGNLFGDKVTSKKSWDIEVYNGHAYAAAFHLVDQIPISKTDRINVDIKELGEGELNKETGIVKWKKNISGKSSEKIILKYNVKAKKKDNVIVE